MTDAPPAYRDSHGRALTDYPRPSVAVDTAVLTVAEGALHVLLTKSSLATPDAQGSDRPRLPGTFLHPGERLADAALRSLREKAGVGGLQPRQLHVFDDPQRDDRGWVLSVAHLDAVPADRIPLTDRTELAPVGSLPPLEFDHDRIVSAAAALLRDEYRAHPDPAGLLPNEPFTMRDLRLLHEAVLGEPLVADTFRRTMLPGLVSTGALRRGVRGKPAELFTRAKQASARG